MGASEDRAAIRKIIREINEAWTKGHPEKVGEKFHPEMVLAPPGGTPRAEGREACVQSYVDFNDGAETKHFDAAEATVDIFGDTAITTTRFEIDYAIGGDVYSEVGHDVLIFQRADESWLVVWRTMQWEPRCDE